MDREPAGTVPTSAGQNCFLQTLESFLQTLGDDLAGSLPASMTDLINTPGDLVPKKGRGGARAGAGRRKIAAPTQIIDGRTITGKSHAQYLLDALNDFDPKKETDELAGWRRLWDATDKRVALEVRRYLYDKAGGKAVVTVNHVHDKPIEHNHTLNLGAGMREAMQKAEARLLVFNGGKSA